MTAISLSRRKVRLETLIDDLEAVLAAAQLAWDSAPHRFRALADGQTLEARAADPSFLETAARSLLPSHKAGDADARILVSSDDDDLGLDHPRWPYTHFPDREIEARLHETPYRVHYFEDIGFWQIYDRENGFGFQGLGPARAIPPWDGGSPLRNFLHWHLLDAGAGLVHGGTVGLPGRGLLLTGDGGAGKSGTVLSGLLRGLISVGDDYVSIRLGDRPVASRVFSTMKQDPEGCRRLGLSPRDDTLNWQGKHLLSLRDLALASLPDGLPLVAIGLPHITHAPRTTIRPATGKEVFLAMTPAGVMQIPAARSEMFARCATLSRSLPAWHIDLGTDPEEVADFLRGFLEGFRQ